MRWAPTSAPATVSNMTTWPVVEFIVAQPGMAKRRRVAHVDDGTGRCGGCNWQETARPAHPCLIRWYAERATGEVRRRAQR